MPKEVLGNGVLPDSSSLNHCDQLCGEYWEPLQSWRPAAGATAGSDCGMWCGAEGYHTRRVGYWI
jgi:hypothetical protein